MKLQKSHLVSKNSHGILPDIDKAKHHRLRWTPEGISSILEKFVDILMGKKADLCVIDMFHAMEGQGPAFGDIVEMGLVLAGADVVAVDSVCEALMGFDPMEIELTRIAHERGIGIADLNQIEIVGEKIENHKRSFKRANPLPDLNIPPQMESCHGDSCLGCYMPLRYVLDVCNHFLTKDLTEIPPIGVQVGLNPPEPKVAEYILCFGDCAIYTSQKAKQKYRLGKKYVDVPGCPPLGLEWAESFARLVGKMSPAIQITTGALSFLETEESKLPRDFNPRRWWWDTKFAMEHQHEISKYNLRI